MLNVAQLCGGSCQLPLQDFSPPRIAHSFSSASSASACAKVRRSLPWFPNYEISLHFLVQCRAEVGAVKRKHSGLVQFDVKRFCFARVHHHIDVVLDQSEPVNHVAGLLDVGHGDSELVTYLSVDSVRVVPTADGH